MTTPADFWWQSVTGPRRFISETLRTLQESCIPLLQIPIDLPWRHTLRGVFQDLMREESPDVEFSFDIIDVADQCANQDIGDFLLEHYASQDVARSYRPRSGRCVQQYMADNGVLHGKLLWVKGIPPSSVATWCAFCQKFESPSLENGCFVIEYRGEYRPSANSAMRVLRFEDYVSNYDVHLYSAFLLSDQEKPLSRQWQGYAAAVSSRLCGLDAELCEIMLRSDGWVDDDPLVLYRRAFAKKNSELPSDNDGDLRRKLWTAQLETLFPRIEFMRMEIIQSLHDELASALEFMPIKQFEQNVTCPEELELSSIAYLMAKTMPGSWNRLVYVPDEKKRQLIFRLKECRNLLAHGKCCGPDDAGFILDASVSNMR